MGSYFQTQRTRTLRKADPAKPEQARDLLQAEPNAVWQSLALEPPASRGKHALSQPDDPWEREADLVAERVMQMSPPQTTTSSAHATLRDPAVTVGPTQAGGKPLDPATRRFFETRLGRDLSQIRIHADREAAAQAAALHASAFTVGQNIAFGQDRYQPGNYSGRRLIAHELTHVIQQSCPPNQASGSQTSAPVSRITPTQPTIQRQVSELGIMMEAYQALRAYAARDEVVEMEGQPYFNPSPDLREWIRRSTQGGLFEDVFDIAYSVLVNVRFGDLGTARVPVYMDRGGRIQTDGTAPMDLRFRELGNEDPAVSPCLLFGVIDSRILGVFGGVRNEINKLNQRALMDEIVNGGARRLMEWGGMENLSLVSERFGELINGHLDLKARTFSFDLASAFKGSGIFGIHDGTVTFNANTSLHVPGLDDATLNLVRDEDGNLSGTANMAVTLGGFNGRLLASFGRGVLDIRGTATYRQGGFEGSITLMVTDEASAWKAVNGELARWPPAGVGAPTPGLLVPAVGVQTSVAASPTRHVVAGWGVVEFRYKDWLHGRAQVIVDPDGDITSLGRVGVPQDIQFLNVKSWGGTEIGSFDSSVKLAGFWAIAAVRVGGEGSIRASASIGPGHLRDLHAAGAFSTKPGFQNHLTIGGTLELQAGASVTLNLTGYVRVYVQVPVVGEVTSAARLEVASVDMSLRGTGELTAYAIGEAAIHRTSVRGSDEADYSMAGTLTVGGQLGFTIHGPEVRVRIPFHDFRLLRFEDTYFPLGSARGSVSFRNFKIGSAEPPRLQVEGAGIRPAIKQLYDGIIRDGDGIPPQPQVDDSQGTWTPVPGDTVGPEGDDPDPPIIPTDPHFGLPTTPPKAAQPATQQPPPSAGTIVDQPGGTGDASDTSPVDAGPADAGTDVTPVDAAVPPPAAVEDYQPTAEPAPEPLTDRRVEVPFDMQGSPHELVLAPGPVLLMESEPGRLVLKLQRKREEVNRVVTGDPIRGPRFENQRNVLDELIREAQAVEDEAARLGFGERFSGTVPGLRPLADRLHRLAQQFDWHDIVAFLPTEPSITVEQAEAMPPAAAQQALGLPFDQFMIEVENLPAAQAVPLLREQRRYYEQELLDINNYMRARPGGPTAIAMERRQQELITRIAALNLRIRQLQDVIRPDGRPELPCFSPDTLVHTPDGPRPIGSLHEGDKILTCADSADVPVIGQVTAVHRKMTLQFFAISVEGVVVRATGRHPFWIEECGAWVAASELQKGQHVRLVDGRIAPIDSVKMETEEGALTVDLSVSPYSTYFVGAGVFVHNTPPLRDYGSRWRHADGRVVSGGPFKIYLGRNPTSTEWDNCIYVGQTAQDRARRESGHRNEAQNWLNDHLGVPDSDPEKRYYRFKQNIHLDLIAVGLLADAEDPQFSAQADWLEQENIDYERSLRGELRGVNYDTRKVMNRREQLRTSKAETRNRLVNDPIVRASGFC